MMDTTDHLLGLLAYLMGDNPDGKVYLAEDAPRAFVLAVNDATDPTMHQFDTAIVPWVDPAAKESK